MGKCTLPVEGVPRKLMIEVLSEVLCESGYERTMNYLPIMGHKDLYEFTCGEEKVTLIIDKRGEAEEVLTLQGPEEVLRRLLVELALRSTLPLYRRFLSQLVDETSLNRLISDIERLVREEAE